MLRSPFARGRLPGIAALAVCFGLACAAPAAVAAPYTGFYVFGDSLSDTGNVAVVTGGAIPPAPYVGGAFTNGPTWADRFAADSSLFTAPQPPLAPGSLLGNVGADYAWGGARTYGHSNPALTPIAQLSAQINAFAIQHGSVADPNALYALWIGANDMQDAIAAAATAYATALAGGATPAAAQLIALPLIDGAVTVAIHNIDAAIATLLALGADELLVANLPDLALTPRLAPAGALAHYASVTFNDALLDLLMKRPGTAHLADIYGWFNGLLANPGAYGFTNTTAPCYTGDDLTFVPNTGTVCATPDNYVFWDTFHPTAAVDALVEGVMVNALAATIPEPALSALFAAGLLGLGGARRARRG